MVTARGAMILAGAVLCFAPAAAEEESDDVPDVDFLEYLGMWEESDEDWLLFEEETVAENEERSDPAPKGEESREKEDES